MDVEALDPLLGSISRGRNRGIPAGQSILPPTRPKAVFEQQIDAGKGDRPMAEGQKNVMRSMDMNARVRITLPAHVWLAYLSAYSSADWSNPYATMIMIAVRDRLFDPEYVKAQEDDARRQHEQQHQILSGIGIIPGFARPDVPPPDDADEASRPGKGLYP